MTNDAQARVVRDATLRNTQRLMDNMPELRLREVSPRKRVLDVTKRVVRNMKRTDLFAAYAYSHISPKKQYSLIAGWEVDRGQLVAYGMVVSGFPVPDVHEAKYDLFVSRHAIERAAKRLDTQNQKAIRDEFASLVIAALMHTGPDGTYQAVTPHGFAPLIFEGRQVTVPTWISRESASGKWRGDWTLYKGTRGFRMEIAGGGHPCKIRPAPLEENS